MSKEPPQQTQQQPQQGTSTPRVRVFSISGVTHDEKIRYHAIITELGGDLDLGLTISGTTTHLIIGTPSKSYFAFYAYAILIITLLSEEYQFL